MFDPGVAPKLEVKEARATDPPASQGSADIVSAVSGVHEKEVVAGVSGAGPAPVPHLGRLYLQAHLGSPREWPASDRAVTAAVSVSKPLQRKSEEVSTGSGKRPM